MRGRRIVYDRGNTGGFNGTMYDQAICDGIMAMKGLFPNARAIERADLEGK